jgi:hypothetical protein
MWPLQETPSTECSPDSDGSLLDSTDTLEMKGKEVLQSPLYEESEYLRPEVLMAVNMKITDFWDVTPCNLVK